MAKKVLTHTLSEPLGGATTAQVDFNMIDGNLTIDGLAGGEPVLASATLQYLENQGLPTRSANRSNARATFALKASGKGQPWIRLPWSACNSATTWQIHLNPAVSFDITAYTGGGNVSLDLAGMVISRVSAETGGGNLQVVLPDCAAGLKVTAKTGAGNVVARIPGGVAARIHAASGLGQVIVDPRFDKVDDHTYQSPDYATSGAPLEIAVSSGAGNVSIEILG